MFELFNIVLYEVLLTIFYRILIVRDVGVRFALSAYRHGSIVSSVIVAISVIHVPINAWMYAEVAVATE